tara:strand:+ start:81 stop:494 length:414 start_codon:yes stop_codon:yes gene_type:complete
MVLSLLNGAGDHIDRREVLCLAEAIYHEARGESLFGQMLVAETVLNRVDDNRWPNTTCGVVYQPYQFDGPQNYQLVNEEQEMKYAIQTAAFYLSGYYQRHYPNIRYFYNPSKVTPEWATNKMITVSEGDHLFMEDQS